MRIKLAKQMFILLFFYFFLHAKCAVYMNIPEINRDINKTDVRLHLQSERVKSLCYNRESICLSNNTVVCTVKYVGAEAVYKDFNNSCLLFFSNMCDHPEEEFNIVSGTTCDIYLKSRRSDMLLTLDKAKTAARKKTPTPEPTTLSTLYDIDTAFDYHICPMSCPDTYEPVCVCVNRNFGLYFKFFTFTNHCEADRYYCLHWIDFSPPPDETEKVQSSPLGWSYCGSSKYLMLNRFSEATASLGHYGWLNGDYKYSHIMEPNEKKPGYG